MRRLLPFFALGFLLAGCGGAKTVSPTAETVVGSVPQTTTAQAAAKGDAKAGETLFTAQGCGGCHKFQAAGTNGTVGPDLDHIKPATAAFIRQSIVDPNKVITKGFPKDVMPQDFGQKLSSAELTALVKYLLESQR